MAGSEGEANMHMSRETYRQGLSVGTSTASRGPMDGSSLKDSSTTRQKMTKWLSPHKVLYEAKVLSTAGGQTFRLACAQYVELLPGHQVSHSVSFEVYQVYEVFICLVHMHFQPIS